MDIRDEKKITDFLRTKTSKKDLRIALRVLREFKECESTTEWLMIMFDSWAKLEQFQEFLEHLVEGEPLQPDTIAYMKDESILP